MLLLLVMPLGLLQLIVPMGEPVSLEGLPLHLDLHCPDGLAGIYALLVGTRLDVREAPDKVVATHLGFHHLLNLGL